MLKKKRNQDLYWVVNKDSGKRFSKEPIPKERAKAQMRALYLHLKGGGTEANFVPEFNQAVFDEGMKGWETYKGNMTKEQFEEEERQDEGHPIRRRIKDFFGSVFGGGKGY